MSYPNPSDVRTGVVFGESDELVGTLKGLIDNAGVLQGVSGILDDAGNYFSSGVYGYGGTNGFFLGPITALGAGNVLSTADIGEGITGSYIVPDPTGVGDWILFGANGAQAGTLPSAAVLVTNGGTLPTAAVLTSAGGGLPLTSVLTSDGGSLPLDSVLNTDGGNFVAPDVSTVQAGVNFGASGGLIGTYDPVPAAVADQLATDTAAVNAGKADILTTRTILGVTGTLSLAGLTASNIRAGVVIGGVTGTLVYGAGTSAAALASRPGTSNSVNRAQVIEDSPIALLARVLDGNGSLLTPSNTTAVSVKVFDRESASQVGSALTLSVSDAIRSELVTNDPRWTEDTTGYNVSFMMPGSYFPDGGRHYRVEIAITPVSGSVFYVLWDVSTTNLFSV